MRANYKIQRLFLEQSLRQSANIKCDKPQINYLANVLRMKSGDQILLFNGRDGEWLAEILFEGKRSIILDIKEQTRNQPEPSDLIYCFAPLKIGRLDYMVQKAVEMGAGTLQPVLTQHTQNHRLNMDKLSANVIEAAEQCGILSIPVCHEPTKFDAFYATGTTNAPSYSAMRIPPLIIP